MTNVLVLGATGHVGQPLVSALLEKGVAVKAASRSGKDIGAAKGTVFDYFDSATINPAFEGVDAAYVMLAGGYTGADTLLLPVIAAAKEHGVKVVLQTAFGVNADDSIPYRKVELALEAAGIPYVILRPNWFMDNFHTFWKAGIDQGVIALPAGEGKSAFIDVRDIAAVAAQALTSDEFDNQALDLTGPEALSYAEAASMISEATGKTVSYSAISDADFIAGMVNAGLPKDYAEFLTSIFYPVREGWTAAVTDAVEKATGKTPRSLAQYIADHSAEL
ncbi:MAG: SDR family oxidoreductase [Thalassolituus sp.]